MRLMMILGGGLSVDIKKSCKQKRKDERCEKSLIRCVLIGTDAAPLCQTPMMPRASDDRLGLGRSAVVKCILKSIPVKSQSLRYYPHLGNSVVQRKSNRSVAMMLLWRFWPVELCFLAPWTWSLLARKVALLHVWLSRCRIPTGFPATDGRDSWWRIGWRLGCPKALEAVHRKRVSCNASHYFEQLQQLFQNWWFDYVFQVTDA